MDRPADGSPTALAGRCFRFTAYDGSAAGPADAPVGLHLRSARGAPTSLTAPGSLGMARAYVAGRPARSTASTRATPTTLLRRRPTTDVGRRPPARRRPIVARSLGVERLVPPPPPPQEALPRLAAGAGGPAALASRRDAEAIHHHYDVSNTFYEYVLGPSMTYTCAVLPARRTRTLEEAQANKYDLVFRKLGLEPGSACSTSAAAGAAWSGTPPGVRGQALGVTLSREQAAWAQEAIRREGLQDLAEVRHGDYRDVTRPVSTRSARSASPSTSACANYPAYFGFLHDQLRAGGRLLNHCITRPDNVHARGSRGGFIDRYVFPDGELTGSGRIITAMQDVGASRSGTRRTCASTTPDLPGLVRATWSSTGTRASPRSARRRPRCGASTSPVRGSVRAQPDPAAPGAGCQAARRRRRRLPAAARLGLGLNTPGPVALVGSGEYLPVLEPVERALLAGRPRATSSWRPPRRSRARRPSPAGTPSGRRRPSGSASSRSSCPWRSAPTPTTPRTPRSSRARGWCTSRAATRRT